MTDNFFAIGDRRWIEQLRDVLAELECPTCGRKAEVIADPADGTQYADFPCKHDQEKKR